MNKTKEPETVADLSQLVEDQFYIMTRGKYQRFQTTIEIVDGKINNPDARDILTKDGELNSNIYTRRAKKFPVFEKCDVSTSHLSAGTFVKAEVYKRSRGGELFLGVLLRSNGKPGYFSAILQTNDTSYIQITRDLGWKPVIQLMHKGSVDKETTTNEKSIASSTPEPPQERFTASRLNLLVEQEFQKMTTGFRGQIYRTDNYSGSYVTNGRLTSSTFSKKAAEFSPDIPDLSDENPQFKRIFVRAEVYVRPENSGKYLGAMITFLGNAYLETNDPTT
jgi:hypothetical protein